MKDKFNPGEPVYVVERDEDGLACDMTGYLFLAKVNEAIIVTPKVFGCDTLDEILGYHIQQTAQSIDTDLAVFPADDCYRHKLDAELALKEEVEGETGIYD